MSKPPSKTLKFEPLFDLRGGRAAPVSERTAVAQPDSRGGEVYKMSAPLHLAVEVALTTGRPLLLRGEPGTGKSSLAAYVARRLGWRYYEHVVTSTSTATDLLWRFDAVRRLADAQAKDKDSKMKPEAEYVSPGVLWWALDGASARDVATKSGSPEPYAALNAQRDQRRAVVLIDEIDKAHPDLPNGLLVALGSNQIPVPYLPKPVEIDVKNIPPLAKPKDVEIAPVQVVVTTNEERELPPAFVRRCVTFSLTHPDADELVEIARAHFHRKADEFSKSDEALALKIAERLVELRKNLKFGEHRPSTAEFLDAFRASRARGIKPDEKDERWMLIERITLQKPGIGSLV
jgi:MoxR-like ATPase